MKVVVEGSGEYRATVQVKHFHRDNSLTRAIQDGQTVNKTDLDLSAPAKTETPLGLRLKVPAEAKPGRYALPIDIRYADRLLPQFSEAIVVVK